MTNRNGTQWEVAINRGRRIASIVICPLLAFGAAHNLYMLIVHNKILRPRAIIKYQEVQSHGAFWFDLCLNLFVLAACLILIWLMIGPLVSRTLRQE